MRLHTTFLYAASLCTIQLVGGCGPAPAEIPVGEWAGRGTYVDYEAISVKGKQADTKQRAKDGSYETRLKITRARAYGREATVLEIHSGPRQLFNVEGEETSSVAVLVKLDTLDNGSILYAVYTEKAAALQPSEPREPSALPPGTLALATCIRSGRGPVLQVYYWTPERSLSFIDTFHFETDRVVKTGRFTDTRTSGSEEKLIEVYWVEELRR